MKSLRSLGIFALVASSAILFSPLSAYADSNEEQLKALENAMRASGGQPSEPGVEGKPKRRTRAIVFDAEPATQNAAASPASPQAAPSVKDCQNLPAGVQGVGVDFAINFNLGSADVASSSEGTLLQIGKVLSLNPTTCIIVEGHTDSTGNAERNLALSNQRAMSVVRFVSDKGGIERNRLVPLGKGSSEPLKNLDSRDAKNRRVVFKVVGG